MQRWSRKYWISILMIAMSICTIGVAGCNRKKPMPQTSDLQSESVEHTHVWESGDNSKAVCGQESEIVYTCADCGERKVEIVFTEHKEKTTAIAATCQAKGYTLHQCENCGSSYRDAFTNALSHEFESETVAGTCTTNAKIVYDCKNCTYFYEEGTGAASGHDTDGCVWTDVGETCKEGCVYIKKQETTCKACGEKVTRENEFEKHAYEFVRNNVSATCVAEGEMLYACSTCGEETTDTYSNAEAHDWQKTQTDSATGITSYVCKHNSAHTKTMFSAKDKVTANITADVLKEVNEIELKEAVIKMDDAVREQFGSEEISLSADTLDDTAKNAALKNMTAAEKEKIGDKPIYDFTLENQNGLVSSFNGKMTITIPYTLSDGEDPANIGVWYINSEGKADTIQAQYDNGFATFETDHFSYYTVVRLTPEERCALYGHSFWMPKTIAPTCTTEGYTIKSCKRCAILEHFDVEKALGHDYEGIAVHATCTEKGYIQYTCKTCNDSYAADYTEAGTHDYQTTVVAPTCEEKGYTQYVCSVCEDSYNDNYVDAIGHSYLNDVKAPTCTEAGHDQSVCEHCGKTHINSDFGAALGHDYQTSVIAPSCGKEGYTLHMCSRCGDNYKTDEKEALKHDYELTSGGEDFAIYTCKNCGDSYKEVSGEQHNLQVRYELTEGAITCEDGVVRVEYCTECEYKRVNDFIIYDHNTFREEIAKEDTACGETVLYRYGCACGKEASVGVIHASGMSGGHNSIYHEDGREGTRIIWECDSCDFTYWQDTYEEKTNCMVACEMIIHFGKTADGYAYSVSNVDAYESHNTKETTTQLEDGFVERKYVCKDCEKTTKHYKQKLDEYGRCLEEYNLINGHYTKWEYDNCQRKGYEYDVDGNLVSIWSGDGHEYEWRYQLMEGAETCLDGVYGINACVVCGEEIYREEYYNSHYGSSISTLIYTECGNFEIVEYECACGQGNHIWIDNGDCNFNRVNRVQLDNENDEKQNHYLATYECASCGYGYTKEYYNIRGNCTQTQYTIYTVDGNTYESEETYEFHNTRTESGPSTTEGATWYKEICVDCEELVSFYERIQDEFGRTTYRKDFLENTSYTRVYREDCYYTQTNYEGDEAVGTREGQNHGRIETSIALKEGSVTCEEGVIGTQYCIACGMEMGTWEDYGHTYYGKMKKTVETDALCGDITIYRYGCACGMETGYFELEGNCDFNRTYNWIGEDGDKKEYETCTYRCAVTACGYTVTEDRYYIAEGCYQHWYYIYHFDVKKDGSYSEEWTFDEMILAHDSEYTYEYNADGGWMRTGVCISCGMTTYVEQYDKYGRDIYYMSYVKQSGWKRIYNGCQYDLHTYQRSTGEFVYVGTYTQHATNVKSEDISCTQFVDGTCQVCGIVIEDEFYPWEHKYRYDSEKETYVCYRCGLENPNGADGSFLMEDMSDDDGIKVGIFQRWHNKDLGNVYVVADYYGDNPVHLEGVEYTVEKTGGDSYNHSGIITIDMGSLQEKIQEKGVAPTEISVVIEAYDDESGTYLDYILTFETW